MSSAQLEILPGDESAGTAYPLHTEETGPSELKQQVAERLAAHRQRRGRHPHGVALGEGLETQVRRGKKNPVAAAVAERYAQTPSFRAFLAEEAQRAIEQAAAAAAVAARNAAAVAAVQGELLAELEMWVAPQEFTSETAVTIETQAVRPQAIEKMPVAPSPGREARLEGSATLKFEAAAELDAPTMAATILVIEAPVKQVLAAGLTVRLYEDLGPSPRDGSEVTRQALRGNAPDGYAAVDAEESQALDEEIAFRQATAPVFDDFGAHREPSVPLPANLLEFPRQLVATKKARPRLAEGPLREDSAPRNPQLRIFEVEPEQISTSAPPAPIAPEWSMIWLDAHKKTEPMPNEDSSLAAILPSLLPPHTAPMQLRMMAAAMDATLVLGGFVAFVAVFAEVTAWVPSGITAAIGAAGVIAALYLMYQVLFFTLNDQTPGMRYARIGFCTFSDENPSRAAMRKRILAQIVAVCPFGLGLLWALLDDDGLGWHDRISRMYQRAY